LTCTFQVGYFAALFLHTLPSMPDSSGKAAPSGKASPAAKAGEPDQASLLSEAAASQTGEAAPAFEQAMQELEQLVTRMESGELTLEQSLAAYKRGARLLQICQGALQDAQQQVKILEQGLLQDLPGGTEQD